MSDVNSKHRELFIKTYIDSGGNTCPNCQSDNIGVTDSISFDSGIGWQPILCSNCSTTWHDDYILTSISKLDIHNDHEGDN